MHTAVNFGRSGIVRTLINYGADVNAVNKEGYTPLDRAIKHNTDSIIQMLRDAGAENRHVRALKQTLKDCVSTDGVDVNLDPTRYTVVRADSNQGIGWVNDLKDQGLRPAVVVAEAFRMAAVFKHNHKEQDALMEKLEATQPGLDITRGGSVRPAMVMEASGVQVKLGKILERPVTSPSKGKGMEL